MILRPPGREGGQMRSQDERLFQAIAQRGEKMLPFYRSMITWKDLYTVWGGEFDWFYSARGVLAYCNELWNMRNLDKSTNAPSDEDEAAFLRYVLLNEGVVKWHEFDHPTYGKIEIGGTAPELEPHSAFIPPRGRVPSQHGLHALSRRANAAPSNC
jgi:hypothetical protein